MAQPRVSDEEVRRIFQAELGRAATSGDIAHAQSVGVNAAQLQDAVRNSAEAQRHRGEISQAEANQKRQAELDAEAARTKAAAPTPGAPSAPGQPGAPPKGTPAAPLGGPVPAGGKQPPDLSLLDPAHRAQLEQTERDLAALQATQRSRQGTETDGGARMELAQQIERLTEARDRILGMANPKLTPAQRAEAVKFEQSDWKTQAVPEAQLPPKDRWVHLPGRPPDQFVDADTGNMFVQRPGTANYQFAGHIGNAGADAIETFARLVELRQAGVMPAYTPTPLKGETYSWRSGKLSTEQIDQYLKATTGKGLEGGAFTFDYTDPRQRDLAMNVGLGIPWGQVNQTDKQKMAAAMIASIYLGAASPALMGYLTPTLTAAGAGATVGAGTAAAGAGLNAAATGNWDLQKFLTSIGLGAATGGLGGALSGGAAGAAGAAPPTEMGSPGAVPSAPSLGFTPPEMPSWLTKLVQLGGLGTKLGSPVLQGLAAGRAGEARDAATEAFSQRALEAAPFTRATTGLENKAKFETMQAARQEARAAAEEEFGAKLQERRAALADAVERATKQRSDALAAYQEKYGAALANLRQTLAAGQAARVKALEQARTMTRPATELPQLPARLPPALQAPALPPPADPFAPSEGLPSFAGDYPTSTTFGPAATTYGLQTDPSMAVAALTPQATALAGTKGPLSRSRGLNRGQLQALAARPRFHMGG